MTNKNNLEIKTEKEEIGNIWKTFIPYVPFVMFLPKYKNITFNSSTSSGIASGTLISIAFGVGSLIYGAFSISNGSLNYNRWSGAVKQREIEKAKTNEMILEKSFNYIDNNKDGKINFQEFEKFAKNYDSISGQPNTGFFYSNLKKFLGDNKEIKLISSRIDKDSSAVYQRIGIYLIKTKEKK